MIVVNEIRKAGMLSGFNVSGHAEYAEYGKDIVCSAISTLSINAINALYSIANVPVMYEITEDITEYDIECNINEKASTILEVTQLGYKSIAEQYPKNVSYVDD